MMLLMNGGDDGDGDYSVDGEYDGDDNNASCINVDQPDCDNPRPKSSLGGYLGHSL